MGKNKSKRKKVTEVAKRMSAMRKLENMTKKDGKRHVEKEG